MALRRLILHSGHRVVGIIFECPMEVGAYGVSHDHSLKLLLGDSSELIKTSLLELNLHQPRSRLMSAGGYSAGFHRKHFHGLIVIGGWRHSGKLPRIPGRSYEIVPRVMGGPFLLLLGAPQETQRPCS